MDKNAVEQHIAKSTERLFSMLDKIYDVPVSKWDDTETDMVRDIWEAMHHMCEVKKLMP